MLHGRTKPDPESINFPENAISEALKFSDKNKAKAAVEQWEMCNEQTAMQIEAKKVLTWEPSKGDVYKKGSIKYAPGYPIIPWDGKLS